MKWQQVELAFSKRLHAQHHANVLGMSEKSLSRLCLANAAVLAKRWVMQRIALEAKRLLAHTSMTVQIIAYELGFEDTSNFVKFFHRQAGLTPLAF